MLTKAGARRHRLPREGAGGRRLIERLTQARPTTKRLPPRGRSSGSRKSKSFFGISWLVPVLPALTACPSAFA